MATQFTTDLAQLTDEELFEQKRELEARLARFQKAFLEQYGRNPDEHERAPAKPAIRRYRDVCKELGVREQEARRTLKKRRSTGSNLVAMALEQAQAVALQGEVDVEIDGGD